MPRWNEETVNVHKEYLTVFSCVPEQAVYVAHTDKKACYKAAHDSDQRLVKHHLYIHISYYFIIIIYY